MDLPSTLNKLWQVSEFIGRRKDKSPVYSKQQVKRNLFDELPRLLPK
jgi:hypothetical protein